LGFFESEGTISHKRYGSILVQAGRTWVVS
jgi:hypothetical protein